MILSHHHHIDEPLKLVGEWAVLSPPLVSVATVTAVVAVAVVVVAVELHQKMRRVRGGAVEETVGDLPRD